MKKMNVKEIIRWFLPYKKGGLKKVTFFFSSMTEDEAGRLHDALGTSITCPKADLEGKEVECDFAKTVDVDSTIAKLKKEGFKVLPEKTVIKPSSEKEWNFLSILLLIVVVYLAYRFIFTT